MRLLFVVCGFAAIVSLGSAVHAASCTEADVATYHKLEREYDATLKKCIAALNAKSPNVCRQCRSFHDTMWKAERWRDSHGYCVEQTTANLKRVRKYHDLTRQMDKAVKADCGF
ncbi:hypothetical protein [Aestuariivirga sp.]|uniref:hypothetical protein n=1 Tax=Aestuariivirga sp. TaxID=2650926 RepID=UPI0035B4E926